MPYLLFNSLNTPLNVLNTVLNIENVFDESNISDPSDLIYYIFCYTILINQLLYYIHIQLFIKCFINLKQILIYLLFYFYYYN